MEGYRVITATYTYFPNEGDAIAFALKGRGEGKRTEVITEEDYTYKHIKPMQDLTKLKGYKPNDRA